VSTNHIKWNDTDNRLTAYCGDDSGETEIGPAKWDDTNNKLEINCNSTDFQAKWNDATNKLEAQSVASECCCVYTCDQCTDTCIDDQCFNAEHKIEYGGTNTYTGTLEPVDDCCWAGNMSGGGVLTLTYYNGEWQALTDSDASRCGEKMSGGIITRNFTCDAGGTIIQDFTPLAKHTWTFTPTSCS